jgi:glycosyltransferase involved in cell wall biosynthesis
MESLICAADGARRHKKEVKPRKIVGKLAQNVPGSHGYLQRKRQSEHISLQQDEITGLKAAIQRLERRNDEWAAEVRQLRGDDEHLQILLPMMENDVIAANYLHPPKTAVHKPHKPPFVCNWVIPPVGSISGGHAVLFRIIEFLESQGHTCRIYFYDGLKQTSFAQIKKNMAMHASVKAELFYNQAEMKPADALFATGWATAYPVFNYTGSAKKFYLLQDYEPLFEPAGSYHAMADNTYKFGLHGISTSPWVADKLSREYGMKCDVMDLGINTEQYYLSNDGPRKKIVFYARPVTPRRGFELGTLGLKLFHERHPEYEINFIGWDTDRYDIPFPYVNNGIINTKQLNELYNQSLAALALSFTSMSLLPIELMASGCIPVVNDAHHTRMVGYAKQVAYADPNPQAIADKLHELVSATDATEQARRTAAYATEFAWGATFDKIQRILERDLA